jgi:fucose 4-O-acetylase-like acetyltransferase
MRNDIIYIRVFATILVVIGHCWFYDGFSGFHSDILPGYETNGILKWMNKIIYSFHMPVFFFISGLLLASKLRSNKQFKLCSFIANKAKRLLIPYIVITIFYCLPIKTLCGLFDNRDLFTSYLDQIFYATDSHMWFLLALFWCMLVGGCIIYIHYHKPKLYIPILIILLKFRI